MAFPPLASKSHFSNDYYIELGSNAAIAFFARFRFPVDDPASLVDLKVDGTLNPWSDFYP